VAAERSKGGEPVETTGGAEPVQEHERGCPGRTLELTYERAPPTGQVDMAPLGDEPPVARRRRLPDRGYAVIHNV
jgi:hypothetical protein